MLCTLAYDTKLHRPGCVLVQAAAGATITNDLLGKYFDVDDWLLCTTPDMKVYPIEDEQQLKNLAFITKHREKNND